METVLKILGGAVLVVIVAVALVLLVLWFVVRRAVRRVKGLARQMGGPVAPIAIELAVLDGTVPPVIERLAAELETHGFKRVGAFGVIGIPDYEMIGLAHEAEDVYAAVATHPVMGAHVDLHQSAPDGRTLAVTNGKQMTSPTAIPGRTVVRRTGANVGTLLNEWRVARLTGAVNPTPPEGFKFAFEEEYRLVMEFQYREGKFKDIDLEGLSKMSGMKTDPRTAAFIREVRHVQPDWEEKLRAAFLASGRVSATEWEAMRDEVIFVHDGLDDDGISDLLLEIGEDEVSDDFLPAEIDEAGGANPRERFRNAVARMGQAERVTLVASLESPEAFDIYRIRRG